MPRRAGVVGSPISHSLSPALHRAAYRALGLADWRYDAFELAPGELAAWLAARGPEWAGVSVTMPLKREALELADHVEGLAQVVGAANTILLGPGGTVAANTDAEGIVAAVREAAPGRVWRAATILGGGATAATALAALAQLGAPAPRVYARSMARSQGLVQAAARLGAAVEFRRLRQGGQAPDWVDELVVSALPPHAADPLAAALAQADAAAPAGPGGLAAGRVLLDAAYDPWPTALAAAWQAAGGTVVAGKAMLLHQAAEQVRLMTGQAAPLEAMRQAIS
ncbi:MAG: shikimate dehydrogenase [Bifidobacteriaceae bacterium]|nr:shikimate dehydrogenase [Bifidobacteriaceae bacterium]